MLGRGAESEGRSDICTGGDDGGVVDHNRGKIIRSSRIEVHRKKQEGSQLTLLQPRLSRLIEIVSRFSILMYMSLVYL